MHEHVHLPPCQTALDDPPTPVAHDDGDPGRAGEPDHKREHSLPRCGSDTGPHLGAYLIHEPFLLPAVLAEGLRPTDRREGLVCRGGDGPFAGAYGTGRFPDAAPEA